MSDQDDDLFGSDVEGEVNKVTPQNENSGAGSGGDDSDENLFGSDVEEDKTVESSSNARKGGLEGIEDDDDMDIADEAKAPTSEEDRLNAILGRKMGMKNSTSLFQQPRTKSKLYLSKPPVLDQNKEKFIVRMPEVLRVQPEAYDKDSYDPDAEKAEFVVYAEKRGKKVETEAIISDVIRWREKRDSSGEPVVDSRGNPVKESNARLQKMKNGSYRVVVGKSVFAAPLTALSRSYIYTTTQSTPPEDVQLSQEEMDNGVAINSSMNLKCVASLTGAHRINLQVDESNTLAKAIIQQGGKARYGAGGIRIRNANNRELVEKPEVTDERRLRGEEARLRALKKERDMANHPDSRSYGKIGMTSAYLNDDNDGHDHDTQYDDMNLSDIKKGKKKTRRSAAYADHDSDEGEGDMDGFIVRDGDGDDDDGSDADAHRNDGKRKAAPSDDSSDSDIFDEGGDEEGSSEDLQDDEEDGGPQKKRARHSLVVDDDED